MTTILQNFYHFILYMQQDKIFLIKMNNFSVSLQRILMQKGTIPMRICLWLLRFPLFRTTNTKPKESNNEKRNKSDEKYN